MSAPVYMPRFARHRSPLADKTKICLYQQIVLYRDSQQLPIGIHIYATFLKKVTYTKALNSLSQSRVTLMRFISYLKLNYFKIPNMPPDRGSKIGSSKIAGALNLIIDLICYFCAPRRTGAPLLNLCDL